jgi:acetyl/propionyl-CoA carboxylase alpha subunit
VSVETLLRRAGRERRVTLAAAGDGFTATLDGDAHHVRTVAATPPAPAAGGATVEELALEIDGRPVRALVARRADRVLVAVDGVTYVFETGEAARAGAPGAAGSGTVTAPMPGKVVAVLVAPGDRVEAGQALVVLEAMKMETTLAAEVAGTVTAVAAAVGGMLDAGAVVAVIAPAAA